VWCIPIVTNIEFRIPFHHVQDNVAANGVSQQDQAGVSGNMSPEEGQLVFNLPVQTKHIMLSCWGGIWTQKVMSLFISESFLLLYTFFFASCLSSAAVPSSVYFLSVFFCWFLCPLAPGVPTFIVPRTGRYIKKKSRTGCQFELILIFTHQQQVATETNCMKQPEQILEQYASKTY